VFPKAQEVTSLLLVPVPPKFTVFPKDPEVTYLLLFPVPPKFTVFSKDQEVTYLLLFPVPPKFTLFPKDQEVTANGRIELVCAAQGIPTPVITWKVNNTARPGQWVLLANSSNV
jgi:hypothetical protein